MTATVSFRLYVAGEAPHSRRAVHNLNAFCERLTPEDYRIEIIDLFADPARALDDKVLLTPTLVVTVEGGSERRIVGNLTDLSGLADVMTRGTDRS